MAAVTPIHNFTASSGIPMYLIRENHEDGPNETIMPLKDAYLASVARDMPQNGPPVFLIKVIDLMNGFSSLSQ